MRTQFTKIIDCTEAANKFLAKNDFNQELLFYGIQEDVNDYHIHRIVKGSYNEEVESPYTWEWQRIAKGSKGESRDVRSIAIEDLYDQENWDYRVIQSVEEGMKIITQYDDEIIKFNGEIKEKNNKTFI